MDTRNVHYLQIKYVLLTILGILLYFVWYEIALAEYQQTFTISAYYSPLPGQERYVTGSYDGDIRLNGSGVNSADGTPVFPGMIAAPTKYPFGTKMKIPGIGTVAVHDRGGAIVAAGERGHAYDRLDVWMGYGDAGLSRALNWGKRNVLVTVYGIESGIKENVYLEGFTAAEKFIRNIVIQQKIFKEDLWYGQSGKKVGELQEYLEELGYYKGKIDKYYGDEVYKAVLQFQLDEGIIDREEEFGAGYFGPQTRAKIEAVIDKRRKTSIPRMNLGKDDTGDEVKKLQEALKKLDYDIEITGVYDQKTIDAVFDFQKENEILDFEDDLGAGYFGPKTFAVLSQKLAEFNEEKIENIKKSEIIQATFLAFNDNLKLGDKGKEVKRLQEELRKYNLFRTESTGYYGPVTQNAVFKFQQRKGLALNMSDPGAGTFGPQTRATLNGILGYRANTKAIIASKTAAFKGNKNTEETNSMIANFSDDLDLGSSGKNVQTLQETLKKLGYFKGQLITDYFGESTKEAVISFQKEHNIIASEFDAGAGRVGPKTREALNALL